jgi:hypothetical protein
MVEANPERIGIFPTLPKGYPYTEEFKRLVTEELLYLETLEQPADVVFDMICRLKFINGYIKVPEHAASNKFLSARTTLFSQANNRNISVWGSAFEFGEVFLKCDPNLPPIMMFALRKDNHRYQLLYCSGLPRPINLEKYTSTFKFIQRSLELCGNRSMQFAGAFDSACHFHLLALPSSVTKDELDYLMRNIAGKVAESLYNLEFNSANTFSAGYVKWRKGFQTRTQSKNEEVIDLNNDNKDNNPKLSSLTKMKSLWSKNQTIRQSFEKMRSAKGVQANEEFKEFFDLLMKGLLT